MAAREVVDGPERPGLHGDVELLRQGRLQRGRDLVADGRLRVALGVLLHRRHRAIFHRGCELRARQERRGDLPLVPRSLREVRLEAVHVVLGDGPRVHGVVALRVVHGPERAAEPRRPPPARTPMPNFAHEGALRRDRDRRDEWVGEPLERVERRERLGPQALARGVRFLKRPPRARELALRVLRLRGVGHREDERRLAEVEREAPLRVGADDVGEVFDGVEAQRRSSRVDEADREDVHAAPERALLVLEQDGERPQDAEHDERHEPDVRDDPRDAHGWRRRS